MWSRLFLVFSELLFDSWLSHLTGWSLLEQTDKERFYYVLLTKTKENTMFTVMHFFPPSHIHMASFHWKLFFFFFKCTWTTFSKLAEADPAKALTNTHHHHLEIVICWLTGVITEKSVAFMDRLRNVWTAKKSTLSRRDCKLCPVNYKVLKALPNALSCPHRSEKARPEWHHLLLWLQPLPICLRLWLLLPLRWPLLLPGRHPAGSAADPSPRRSHPSALLPRRQLPVHRRPQGNARTDSHTASSREIPEGNNRCWTHTNYQLCLGVKQVTDVALHNINTQVWCKALHDTQSSQHVSAT